jgi:hypothetical protein
MSELLNGAADLAGTELNAAIAAKPGERVTREAIEIRIQAVHYLLIGTTITLCSIHLDNGYSVRGESACVDPANYDEKIGQRLAYDDAFRKLWPLFGFLLAEDRFQRPNDDEAFADRCDRDSRNGRALGPTELDRLFRLAGHKGEVPPHRMAYPPLWEMIVDAKRSAAMDRRNVI